MSDGRDTPGDRPEPPPVDWPVLPTGPGEVELLKILYAAQVAEAAARRADPAEARAARGWARELADKADDAALFKDEHAAMLEVAKGSIARARSGAEAVRNAAAALGTLYTSVLGVAFAVDKGKPLPATGIIPAYFLGLAIVFATAYVAFIWPGHTTPRVQSSAGTLRAQQAARMSTFILWTSEVARRRAWTIHLAVFALGLGVAALPLPFVRWSGSGPWIAMVAGSAGALAVTAVTSRLMHRAQTTTMPGARTRCSRDAVPPAAAR